MKKILIVFFIITGIALGVVFMQKAFPQSYTILKESLVQIEKLSLGSLQHIEKQILTPPPLRGPDNGSKKSFLTATGTTEWTNTQREQNGLHALTTNSKLTAAALAKAQDMFDKQYFEHVSPDGTSVDDLAHRVGYEYIAVGENLATGNFENDQALVQAWMDSPGHRANILNTKFTEIGVAVLQGTFENKKTWMAVQEFGMPASACPSVDANLKQTIDADQSTLSRQAAELKTRKAELESYEARNRDEYQQYREKVSEYNALVNQYNALLEAMKQIIGQYNDQVNAYNNCMGR